MVEFSWAGVDNTELNWTLDEYGCIRNIWLSFAQFAECGLSWAELEKAGLNSLEIRGILAEFGGVR